MPSLVAFPQDCDSVAALAELDRTGDEQSFVVVESTDSHGLEW